MVVVLKRISQRHIRLIFKARASSGERGRATQDQLFVSRALLSWAIVWCILPLQRYAG